MATFTLGSATAAMRVEAHKAKIGFKAVPPNSTKKPADVFRSKGPPAPARRPFDPKLNEYVQKRHDIRHIVTQRFPNAFDSASPRPLMIGVNAELVSVLVDETTRAAHVGYFLRYWTSSENYLRACTEGSPRVNLAGETVGAVTHDESENARCRLQEIAKRKAAKAAAS